MYNQSLNQTIYQKQVSKKSNEIPILQGKLENTDLKDTVISVNAMHAQYKTALLVYKQNAYFLLQVKDDQPTLKAQISLITSEGNGRTLKNDGGHWHMVEKRGRYEVISNDVFVSKASGLSKKSL